MRIKFATISVLAIGVFAATVYAQKTQSIALSGGKASVSGSVRGKSYMDYRVRLGAGQSIAVTMSKNDRSVFFNLNPPKSEAGMYNGSMNGQSMPSRIVPISGEYVVRVYQMGAAADENRIGKYSLQFKVSGSALKPLPASSDAKLRGTPFHARGQVPCKIELEPKRKSAEASVIRYGDGSATVELRFGSMVRRVLFVKGSPKAHDSMESFTYSRESDNTTVRFGDGPSEEYTLPDALIYGG